MERRSHLRVPLDIPFFVKVKSSIYGEQDAMLVDLSRGGLQLAFPPDFDVSELLSHTVHVFGLPKALDPDTAGCDGRISWVSKERCGVRFEMLMEMSDEQLTEISNSI